MLDPRGKYTPTLGEQHVTRHWHLMRLAVHKQLVMQFEELGVSDSLSGRPHHIWSALLAHVLKCRGKVCKTIFLWEALQ